MKTGSESIEAIIRRRWILLAEFVAHMGGHETAEVHDGWRTGEGAREKNGCDVSWTTSKHSV